MDTFRGRIPMTGQRLVFLMLFLALSLLPAACVPSKAALKEQADRHPTRSIGYWGREWLKQPFAERVSPASTALVENITLENRLQELPERPVTAATDPVFSAALKRIEALLPEPLRKLAAERIIGLFLVRDLGSTGYTEAIRDEQGKETFAVIVLDREILLKKSANQWATWKERSFFKEALSRKVELTVRIEKDDEDSVGNAIQLILLHEIGHALGMASGVHPSWNGAPTVSGAWPFTLLSWRMRGATVESRYDETFLQRRALRLYAFEKSTFRTTEAAGVYRQLAETNLPTLYAASTLWEDFAESFVTYLHSVRQAKPYEIRIRDAGIPDAVFTSCWNENRCRTKRIFLEKWLENPLP
jgi:hypothetical protein